MSKVYADFGVPHVGVESEGFVYSKDGEKINVFEWLGGSITVPNGGVISTDAGPHQIEISTLPCKSNEELLDMFNVCLGELPSDWQIYWTGVDPFANGSVPKWSPKPRYNGLHSGLKAEHPNWEKVLEIARYSALNLHFEGDPSSPEGVSTINWLNNQAPVLVQDIHQKIGIPISRRFRVAWRGWADKRRLPHWFWFADRQEMEDYWQSIPRLYKEAGADVWVADLETRPEIGDPVAEGAIWWEARPRWSYGTIEWRSLDSVPIAVIPTVIEEMLVRRLQFLDGKAGEKIPEEDWWQMIEQL